MSTASAGAPEAGRERPATRSSGGRSVAVALLVLGLAAAAGYGRYRSLPFEPGPAPSEAAGLSNVASGTVDWDDISPLAAALLRTAGMSGMREGRTAAQATLLAALLALFAAGWTVAGRPAAGIMTLLLAVATPAVVWRGVVFNQVVLALASSAVCLLLLSVGARRGGGVWPLPAALFGSLAAGADPGGIAALVAALACGLMGGLGQFGLSVFAALAVPAGAVILLGPDAASGWAGLGASWLPAAAGRGDPIDLGFSALTAFGPAGAVILPLGMAMFGLFMLFWRDRRYRPLFLAALLGVSGCVWLWWRGSPIGPDRLLLAGLPLLPVLGAAYAAVLDGAGLFRRTVRLGLTVWLVTGLSAAAGVFIHLHTDLIARLLPEEWPERADPVRGMFGGRELESSLLGLLAEEGTAGLPVVAADRELCLWVRLQAPRLMIDCGQRDALPADVLRIVRAQPGRPADCLPGRTAADVPVMRAGRKIARFTVCRGPGQRQERPDQPDRSTDGPGDDGNYPWRRLPAAGRESIEI